MMRRIVVLDEDVTSSNSAIIWSSVRFPVNFRLKFFFEFILGPLSLTIYASRGSTILWKKV